MVFNSKFSFQSLSRTLEVADTGIQTTQFNRRMSESVLYQPLKIDFERLLAIN